MRVGAKQICGKLFSQMIHSLIRQSKQSTKHVKYLQGYLKH